jgi:predicted GH43/DUF377 family glycosyl hydrolase
MCEEQVCEQGKHDEGASSHGQTRPINGEQDSSLIIRGRNNLRNKIHFILLANGPAIQPSVAPESIIAPMIIKRTGFVLKPNNARVVFRPLEINNRERILKIIGRIMALSEPEVDRLLDEVMREFHGRHQKIRQFFLLRFDQVKHHLLTDQRVTTNRQLLIGSYFTLEYALESAALFNPSLVWHPDQSGLPEGSRRFILSLRATGEGHLSSITFRSGTIDKDGGILVDEPTRFVTAPEAVPSTRYEKALFHRKLAELDLVNSFTDEVLAELGEHFHLEELETRLHQVRQAHPEQKRETEATARGIVMLARANYEIRYSADQPLSERIIFPSSPTELNGIEDARFVEFHDDDGSVRYYATYTAYDGKVVLPQLLETGDFLHFRLSTLNGPEAHNKGMALFPRRFNGAYAMLSRQDNENIHIMFSDMIHFWYTKELIVKPTFPWEYIQLGNCGSPIETEAGWLVLSHGVGPMRKYSMGAFLLDRENPTKVLARLEEPLLAPNANEREGYVPNVVYSCGGLLHGKTLIIPYAMADFASTFATLNIDELLGEMKAM